MIDTCLGYSVVLVYHGQNGDVRANYAHTYPDVPSARAKAISWRKILNRNWDVYVVEINIIVKEKIA